MMSNDKKIINRLSISNLTAQFSEQVSLAALPIISILILHTSAEQTAILQAINTLPFLIISIPAGLLVDKFKSKSLMISMEVLRSISLVILFFLILIGKIDFFSLSFLSFIIATGTVLYSIATPSLVVTMINKENLMLTNRGLEVSRSIAFTLGPSIGGFLAGWSSGVLSFILSLFLSIFSIYFMTGLPKEKDKLKNDDGVIIRLLEGMKFITSNKYLKSIVITSIVFNTSWFLLLSIFSYYAINNLKFSPSEVGVALGIYGLGMICGAYIYPRMAKICNFGRQVTLGPFCAFIASMLMLTTFLTSSRIFVFIAFFMFGCGPIIWTISTTTLRQIITPNNLLSRVSSVILTVTFGARPLGAALGAFLSASFGVKSCLIAVFIGFLLQLIIIMFTSPSKIKDIEVIEEK